MEPRAVKMEWEKRRECGSPFYVKLVIAPEGEDPIRRLALERDVEYSAVYKKTQDVGRVWRVGVRVGICSGSLAPFTLRRDDKTSDITVCYDNIG
ncbi:unnamed protein product, partial [Iphiclides podalirius]